MGTQKDKLKKIINQEADYILSLKNNQATLYEEVENRFKNTNSLSEKTIEKSHGRIEERKCEVIDNLQFIDKSIKWKGIKSVIKISTNRTIISTGKISNECRYYISSLNKSPKEFNSLIRGHWAIKNKTKKCSLE